jgi:hypothetical protein
MLIAQVVSSTGSNVLIIIIITVFRGANMEAGHKRRIITTAAIHFNLQMMQRLIFKNRGETAMINKR